MSTQSRSLAQAAIGLTCFALTMLAIPVLLTLFGAYVEGLGIFVVLYLFVAISARWLHAPRLASSSGVVLMEVADFFARFTAGL